jgi:hypothetical protein
MSETGGDENPPSAPRPILQEASYDSRHLVVVSLLVSIIFAILLGVGLGLVGGKAVTAARDAKRAAATNTANIHDNCVNANKARALNIQLWEYILTLNPQPTAEQKAISDKLLEFVRTTFAQAPCP